MKTQRPQQFEGKDRRSHKGTDDRPCPHRHWRLYRHRLDHQRSGGIKTRGGQSAYAVIKASDVMVAID